MLFVRDTKLLHNIERNSVVVESAPVATTEAHASARRSRRYIRAFQAPTQRGSLPVSNNAVSDYYQ